MKLLSFRFLFCAVLAAVLSLQASAQTSPGKIKVARVEKQVEKIAADNTRAPLKVGDLVIQTDSIVTGDGASVVLVFENGASVRVGSGSRIGVEEFLVDPLSDEQAANVTTAKTEQTKSKTTLNLQYGEMVGDVKKLNADSTYSIKTPVGAAGIRGTIFKIVFKPASGGKAFFTVSTLEGLVVMEGVSAQKIDIPHDKEVKVEIDVPDNPNQPAAPPKIDNHSLPTEVQSELKSVAAVIAVTLQQTTFTPAPPAPDKGSTLPVSDQPTKTPGD